MKQIAASKEKEQKIYYLFTYQLKQLTQTLTNNPQNYHLTLQDYCLALQPIESRKS